MRKYVDGEIIMEDTRWIPSLQLIVTSKDGVKSAIGSMSASVSLRPWGFLWKHFVLRSDISNIVHTSSDLVLRV